MAAGGLPQVAGRPLHDAAFRKQGSQPREITPLPDQGGQQPGLVGSGHRPSSYH